MNKLVIVGNGFDLAHGLPTSYHHFINNFWKTLPNRYTDVRVRKIVHIDEEHDGFLRYGEIEISSYSDLRSNMSAYAKEYGGNYKPEINVLTASRPSTKQIFKFTNKFFEIITMQSIENWVDIENTYYNILKELVTGGVSNHKYTKNIDHLNREFEDVKILLEEYLYEEVIQKYDFVTEPMNSSEILDLFRVDPLYLGEQKKHPLFNEFPTKDHSALIEFDNKLIEFDNGNRSIMNEISWPQNLFLDFNYTQTVQAYVSYNNNRQRQHYGRASQIQIHGKVHSKENKLNFGFGDEMDDDYRLIEKTNNNSYLKNIKSFQYLNTSNYRQLLNWIESNKFQVYIFGHSCGLSDRTLLNTIFEHDNCRSIKLYYYKKESTSDNYTELIQNISRHFNKKALMRTKIVDKTLCKPLFQEIRFDTKS